MVSRIEVHIVSHFREDRTTQLHIVLDAMLGWKNCIVAATITSNVDTYETSGFLRPYIDQFERRGHNLTLNVASGLANPRMLTWEHKKFVNTWLESASPGEDFFIYIEDDIALTHENITYFIRNIQTLKSKKLIPGFIRYEKKDNEIRLVDVMNTEYWQRDRSISIGSQIYHSNLNPYWAGFILDRDLAKEYTESRSFSPIDSEFVPWNIQERSAMGLTYEDPTPRLRSRMVIPIIQGRPDPDCLVWHCSNSYSADNHPVVATLTVDAAYRTETLVEHLGRKAKRLLAKRA